MYLYLIIVNLFGILFLRIICLCQLDIKLIVAISSIVHIRIISIKIYKIRIIKIYKIRIILITKLRLYGWYFIIIISPGLFYLINSVYDQTNRRLINRKKFEMNLRKKRDNVRETFNIFERV